MATILNTQDQDQTKRKPDKKARGNKQNKPNFFIIKNKRALTAKQLLTVQSTSRACSSFAISYSFVFEIFICKTPNILSDFYLATDFIIIAA